MLTRHPQTSWCRKLVMVSAAVFTFASTSAQATCIETLIVPSRQHIYGQLIVVGFEGRRARDAGVKEVLSHIEDGYLGGLLFFARNMSNAGQVRALTRLLNNDGDVMAPFLAIDEEGGKVQRLTNKNGFRHQPNARVVASRGLKNAQKVYRQMAAEVSRAGFDFNLGPVVDLNLRKSNPVIGRLGRSYGSDPGIVSDFAQVFIEAHRNLGIATALKHFPGHGSSRQDSHTREADVTGDWKEVELEPFQELIATSLTDAVMVAHLINRAEWSKDNLPATLSSQAVGLLRNKMNYDGLIISDDLQMKAVARNHTLEQAIIKALGAGIDMVLIGNVLVQQPDTARFAVKIIEKAVAEGTLDHGRLEESFCRVIELKKRIRLQTRDG